MCFPQFALFTCYSIQSGLAVASLEAGMRIVPVLSFFVDAPTLLVATAFVALALAAPALSPGFSDGISAAILLFWDAWTATRFYSSQKPWMDGPRVTSPAAPCVARVHHMGRLAAAMNSSCAWAREQTLPQISGMRIRPINLPWGSTGDAAVADGTASIAGAPEVAVHVSTHAVRAAPRS
jgi:hypothetical protein